jgi:DNA-binding NarL/FixJ family response regulator
MEQHSNQKRIRLIVLSDQALFRTSLARFLASESGLEVVRECADTSQALQAMEDGPVDVVLLDFGGDGADAAGFVAAARSAGRGARLLLLAENADTEKLAAAFKLGASGIFRKSEAPDRLVMAIRMVAIGALWVDQGVIELLANRPSNQPNLAGNRRTDGRLEDREQKVIQGIMSGLTTRKIGVDLNLSEGAVKNTLQGLFAKTGVRKRSQLVRLALEGSLGPGFARRQAIHGAMTADSNPEPHD